MCSITNMKNIGLDNGLSPSGGKPLTKPMITKFIEAYRRHSLTYGTCFCVKLTH